MSNRLVPSRPVPYCSGFVFKLVMAGHSRALWSPKGLPNPTPPNALLYGPGGGIDANGVDQNAS